MILCDFQISETLGALNANKGIIFHGKYEIFYFSPCKFKCNEYGLVKTFI